MIEEWKDILGYEGLYKVSNLGNVFSYHSNKMLNPSKNNKGYGLVKLYKDGKIKTQTVHRLVMKAFVPNPLNKPDINHLNSNKMDNRLINLEWCTEQENILYAFKVGEIKIKKGLDSPFSIFNQLDIDNIVIMLKSNMTASAIAKIYKCSIPTICSIAQVNNINLSRKHIGRKLSKNNVLQIRNLYSTMKYTYKELGIKFKVSPTTIQKIINKTRWVDLMEEK